MCVARWDALTHWYDDLLVEAKAYVGEKRDLVINAGLSVSGLQHVGRLRGEITLSQLLTHSFRDHRRNALQSLVLYTQDEWKAKETQVAQFTKEDGRKYAGRRLIDVPDPVGCHANWVEHFWQDFGGVLDRFAPGIRTVTTTDT
ncbi:MAG: lysine--tRNA ligase, partial [Methanobacteriota archaeon]